MLKEVLPRSRRGVRSSSRDGVECPQSSTFPQEAEFFTKKKKQKETTTMTEGISPHAGNARNIQGLRD
jgi:hypothetical protein